MQLANGHNMHSSCAHVQVVNNVAVSLYDIMILWSLYSILAIYKYVVVMNMCLCASIHVCLCSQKVSEV